MITKVIHMPSAYVDDWHVHSWHQIIFPMSGLLQTTLQHKGQNEEIQDSFIVPHNGILYIPAHSKHKSVALSETQFMAIYLNPNHSSKTAINYPDLQKSCLVSPLLKAVVLALFDKEFGKQSDEMLTNLLRVLRDQIKVAEGYEIPLLIPKDRRLLDIFKQLQKQPDLTLTLTDWALKVGASQRTLSRLCAKQFNQSFSLWRQNIRLVLSLQLLEKQMPIQNIALDLGYQSDSAYIYAFKGLFRKTPSQYRKNHLTNH